MPHPLEAGTLRILRPNGSTAGTGFLVSKRLAVTCAHVITAAKSKPGEVIKFKFHLGDLDAQEAKVLENGWSTENDVAILELTEKLPKWIRPLIMQSSRAMEGRAFHGLGYPNDGPVQMRWPQGNISGRVEVKGYSNPLLQIQGKEIDKGLSGSAVVDRTTRRVIGIITSYQDISRQSTTEQARFGYAIPIETIWKIYPELENELPPLPKRSPLVEGIHLLPHGYDFRIQNFLSEYLGSPDQPEPFGGREAALKELDDWLDGDIQRLVLAAPAGRGKSALLVRWLDRLIARDDLALVFVPVSVRFRTNLASTFFASLAARLAYLHGEDVPTSMETSTDVWRGLASTYLTKSLTDEKKLLVVLDGLDEAGDWEATADFVPAGLPKNVRVVVSARFLAGDADAQPWLTRLGWEHTTKASILDLNPLDADGISDVLLCMGVPLDKLGRRVDIVAELHRLSEGDPLLVNLYVEDLWSRGEQAARVEPENLQKIKPGYEGYFDRWWNDQKKLWGKEAPLREKSVRLIFNFLCCAMGALTEDDLVALDSENELNTYVIENSFEALKRFVIGIPDERREKEIGYVITHPKLRDYLWDKLTEKERTELECRFISWGESIMQTLMGEKLKPVDTPRYLLYYYGVHLERANALAEKFLPFIEYPYWHQAWLIYEGTYGGYLQDVKRVWRVCKRINFQKIQETGVAPLISKEICCALVETSLHSLANQISPSLLALLAKYNIWTYPQVWVYIHQKNDARQQFRSINQLLSCLPKNQYQGVLTTARQIQDDFWRAQTLSALVEFMPEVAEEALAAARQIHYEGWWRATAMIELVKHKPEVSEEALDTICQMQDEKMRASELEDLAEIAPEGQLNKLLTVARQIGDPTCRAQALVALTKRMPDVAEEALVAARQIWYSVDRANALISLVERMPEIAEEALTAAHQIEDMWQCTQALSALTEHVPEVAKEALAAAHQIEDKWRCAQELVALTERMPEVAEEALTAACQIQYELLRADILSDLAKMVSEAHLDKLLTATYQIQDEKSRANVLSSLAKSVPEAQLNGLLTTARQIQDKWHRARVLSSLTERMPEIIGEALGVARQIEDARFRASVLISLVKHMPEVVEEALAAERQILDEGPRAEVLSALVEFMPEATEEALTAARQIRDAKPRAEALITFIQRTPEITEEALAAACQIEHEGVRGFLLETLMTHLHEEQLKRVLAVARKTEMDLARTNLFIALVKRMPEAAEEALVSARQIEGGNRAQTLSALVEFIPEVGEEALTGARQMQDAGSRAEALLPLIRCMPEIAEEIVTAARQIHSETWPGLTLSMLATHMPQEQLNHLLEIARQLQDDGSRAKVLSVLAERMPEVAVEALIAARQTQDELFRAQAFGTLVGRMPEIAEEALLAACQVQREDLRAEVLSKLVQPLIAIPVIDSYRFFERSIYIISARSRADLLSDIQVLLSCLIHVGGEETAHEIYKAVKDVTAWWP